MIINDIDDSNPPCLEVIDFISISNQIADSPFGDEETLFHNNSKILVRIVHI